MRVLVLGAAGFIGSRLVKTLCSAEPVCLGAGSPRPVSEVVLADLRAVPPPSTVNGIATRIEQGDLRNPAFVAGLFGLEYDCIFHFAAALTLDAETDFSLGLDVNVHSLMRLLEHARAQATCPSLVFASSISTFGGVLPEVVDDDVAQTPETSYGTHKAIAELLISDYSRRGFIDGRVLRLPIVLTHPGPASASVSDRIAALIREPLNGRTATCPLDPGTPFPVASVRTVVKSALRLLALPADRFGASRALNLPSLTVTPAEIEAAVVRAGAAGAGRIHWRPDDPMQRIVQSWPRGFTSRRARALGLAADESMEAIVSDYIEDCLPPA